MRDKPLLLVVACALIRPAQSAGACDIFYERNSGAAFAGAETGKNEISVLLAQRPEGKNLAGFWEFPGGKIEQGEQPGQALIRELREELGIEVAAADLRPLSFASHAYEKFHLLMPLYLCSVFSRQPQSREGQVLQWVGVGSLAADYQRYRHISENDAADERTAQSKGIKFPLPPADIPLIPALLAALES